MPRKFAYNELTDSGGSKVVIKTEDQILREYFSWWYKQMKKVNKEKLATKENCIDDWIVVFWAWELPKEAPFACKFCGAPSWVDPTDQDWPSDYCQESDHGY